MLLSHTQREVHAWKKRNFPNSDDTDQLLGVVEEVGELCHAVLKLRQGIRGDNHIAEAKDAVGDIMIFLMNFCSENDWDLEEIIVDVWAEVEERDWQKYPDMGKGEE